MANTALQNRSLSSSPYIAWLSTARTSAGPRPSMAAVRIV
jgi:hypothetical protein